MRRSLILLLGLATAACAQNPVGQIFASDAKVKGAVELAAGGAKVMSGSSVTAGNATAVLKLDRGGEVRVCPKTSVSVATSQNGRDLMLGLSVGGMETHYAIAANADSIVTPDFRILLAGPGRFDFAVESSKNGDTCIRALPGNSSSLIVSELMGDGTYQVKPAERLVFHNGRVANPDHATANCGCVEPVPVLKAETEPPRSVAPPASTTKKDETPVQIEVEAPFVYRADEAEPSPLEEAIHLHIRSKPILLTALAPLPKTENVPHPAIVAKSESKPKKGHFFGHLKAFFASIFR
ncbi:MAG: hypothetical protein ACRD3E_00995 [Terriglobales bacterium]